MLLSKYMSDNKRTDAAFADEVKATVSAVVKWRRLERTPRPVFMKRITAATKGAVTANDFQREGA